MVATRYSSNSSLRICVINDEHYPFKGADTINVIRTAAAMGSAGARVDLVIPKLRNKDQRIETLCEHYGTKPTFNLFLVPTLAPASRKLRIEKLTHNALAPWLSILNRSDVVYSRNIAPAIFAQLAGRPWVLETYRRFADEMPMLPRLTRKLPLGGALGAIAHSQMCAESMKKLGFREEAILVAHSGYNKGEVLPRMTKEEALAQCNLKIDGPVVLHLGSIEPYVRLDWLFEAGVQLPEVTFLLVGGYRHQQEHWRRECARIGLDRVVFVEDQPPAQLRKYLYAADLLAVVPRNADLETGRSRSLGSAFTNLSKVLPGIPMKIFLYRASGIPIFSPDLPYVREILRDRENAFLAPLKDREKVTSTLREAVDNKELGRRLAKNILEDERFTTWEERGARILKFLERRLAARDGYRR